MPASCVFEYSLFISHGIWLLRTRDLRRRAAEAGCSFDEFPEAVEWQESGFKLNKVFGKMEAPVGRRERFKSFSYQDGDARQPLLADQRRGTV